jgi:hypothetical protein
MKYGNHPAKVNHPDPAQGLVEFAVIVPIMLFIIFGIVEIGRIMQSWILIENGVREGASYAASKAFNLEYCELWDCDSLEVNLARVRSIQDIVWSDSSWINRLPEGEAPPDQAYFFSSLVCLRKNLIHPNSPEQVYQCESDGIETWEGETIVVLVEYNHSCIVPFFFIKDPFLRMTARRDVFIREKGSLPPGDG